MVHEHIYNNRVPVFYFCRVHAHTHVTLPTVLCVIQAFKCCDSAISVKDYTQCFAVSVAKDADYLQSNGHVMGTTLNYRNNALMACNIHTHFVNYNIFDPAIWREQSFNHFMSFVRAVICTPALAAERYKRFEASNFTISNIKKYVSGKESLIRTAVTGFETLGIYQTSTISCVLPYYTIMLPQKLYDLLKAADYDLGLVMVTRHPSLLPTCMYVCNTIRNPDAHCDVTTITDQQSKGANQDQDGDHNADYFIPRRVNGYDRTQTYQFKVSKMELAMAFRVKQTVLGMPRYWLSEATMVKIQRHAADFAASVFFRRTHKRYIDCVINSRQDDGTQNILTEKRAMGVRFMNDAAAGYMSGEYDEFQEMLRVHNLNETPSYITIFDILMDTPKLHNIVVSEAKGSTQLLEMLLSNIKSSKDVTLLDRKTDMLDLCNKYIVSSQDLSRNGRKQFAALYAAHDLCSFFNKIYINKICYADYRQFASAGTFLFTMASLELFLEDLQQGFDVTNDIKK